MSNKILTRLFPCFIAICFISPVIGIIISICFGKIIPIIIGLAVPYIFGAILLPFIILMMKGNKDK